MSEKIAEKFIAALADLESRGDVEPIAALFDGSSKVNNVVTDGKESSPKTAREFWQNYRDTFGEVNSEFRNKIYSDSRAALEWTTTGTNKNGQSIKYDGVSILEIDGEKIKRFFAYFDPANLGQQITEQ